MKFLDDQWDWTLTEGISLHAAAALLGRGRLARPGRAALSPTFPTADKNIQISYTDTNHVSFFFIKLLELNLVLPNGSFDKCLMIKKSFNPSCFVNFFFQLKHLKSSSVCSHASSFSHYWVLWSLVVFLCCHLCFCCVFHCWKFNTI